MQPTPRVLRGPTLPPRLLDLEDSPERLHLLGELPRGPSVAIVGTREPTPEARHFAARLARDLARAGIAVLSGGALGIDSAAHLGALRGRGTTVVVAPAGFGKPYPEGNRRLFASIVTRGGAYLSLAEAGAPAERAVFFARNSCLVALSHVLVVVEAGLRSGARNAAAWARKLGRPLLVVPGAPWNPRATGCLLELRRGADLCTGATDVLRALERCLAVPAGTASRVEPPSAQLSESTPPPERDAPFQSELPFSARAGGTDAARVLASVRSGACHLDQICEQTGLAPAAVQNHLLTLTLEGVLVPDPAGGLGAAPAKRPVSRRKARKRINKH